MEAPQYLPEGGLAGMGSHCQVDNKSFGFSLLNKNKVRKFKS